ncbi:hypothetical protein AKO1_002406 [Acrasis kona]|uniref:Glycosyltransferase n=1 Tax=Acrasis kona TaxID=1008807 RepID=A0AAW2ZPW4_9EUKA
MLHTRRLLNIVRTRNTLIRRYSDEKRVCDLKFMYFSPVWAQPNGSAAGVRSYEILRMVKKLIAGSQFKKLSITKGLNLNQKLEEEIGEQAEIITRQIVYVSGQDTESVHANNLRTDLGFKIDILRLEPNKDLDIYSEFLKDYQPDVAIFDTFTSEEKYSWQLFTHAPDCIRVLDTQDLRFLRKHREELNSKGAPMSQITTSLPTILNSEILSRELASMHRCDMNFVVSPHEHQILTQNYKFPSEKLAMAPFYYSNTELLSPEVVPPYEERKDFVFIGSFLHTPNEDAVRYLKYNIWPLIRSKLPEATLHIYGSHPKQHHINLTNKNEKFIVHGHLRDIDEIMNNRVNLAPLRFGAGIKGKIADGWYLGTPCVTTPIGSEGMTIQSGEWGGMITKSDNFDEEFADAAVKLYSDKDIWYQKQNEGFKVIQELFDGPKNRKIFLDKLRHTYDKIGELRTNDVVGNIMWQSGMRTTEYMSKMIIMKEQMKKESTKFYKK